MSWQSIGDLTLRIVADLEARMGSYHTSREAWLQAAAAELADDFAAVGYALPKMRFAIAFPSTGRFGKRVGECWSDTHSRDQTHEIFVRCDQFDPVDVLAILTHEIVHPAVGADAKHGPVFKRCALTVGLKGPMRHTTASPALTVRLQAIADRLGPVTARRARLVAAQAANDAFTQSVVSLRLYCSAYAAVG